MKALWIAAIALAAAGALVGGVWLYYDRFANPRVSRELREEPGGERAARVMLLTLPSGREVPVNYLREDDMVYAGADGRWWTELVGDGVRVEVLVRGETRVGRARAIRDDPDYRQRIFQRLRPNALDAFGTLVEIRLEAP